MKRLLTHSVGQLAEKKFSLKFHTKDNIAVLVSSVFLREHGCGQIDLAYFKKGSVPTQKTLVLCEIKSSIIPKIGQQKRINRSAKFLSQIFNCACQIKYLFANEKLDPW